LVAVRTADTSGSEVRSLPLEGEVIHALS